MEYKSKDFEFSRTKGASINDILISRFSIDKGVGLVQYSSIYKGLEVHENYSRDERLMTTLHGSMITTSFSLQDRIGEVIVVARFYGEFMLWCSYDGGW